MRWALVLVAMAGCGAQAVDRNTRWPHHREQEEQRITDLEAQVKQMTARIAELETALAKLRAAPPAAPPPRPADVPDATQ